MENKYYVYELRIVGEKLPFYIGKGCGDRYKRHFTKHSLARKNFKNNIILKAYREGLEVSSTKLCVNMLEQEAYNLEKNLITKLGRRDISTGVLTNLSEGGAGPLGFTYKQTDEHKRKIQESLARYRETLNKPPKEPKPEVVYDDFGKRIFSDEHKEKLAAAHARMECSECPHCGINCKPQTFKRYHGDKCIEAPWADKVKVKESQRNLKNAGQLNNKAKFTDDDIRQIRILAAGGMSKAAIGRLYNVRDSHICKIVNLQCWAHVV